MPDFEATFSHARQGVRIENRELAREELNKK